MARIADEFRRWRHDRWLTQKQAAQLLQVSLSTYYRWESGRTVPDYRDLQNLRVRFREPVAGVRPPDARGSSR
jgi:transcriptional regulator with XRE-family HTH domain